MARDWEEIYQDKGVVQTGVVEIVEEALPFFETEGVVKVLDAGCGTGRHTVFLASQGFRLWGVDNSPKAVELLGEKVDEDGIKIEDLLVEDVRELSFEDDFFDAVICINVIQHSLLSDIKQSLEEICRVLRPGGILVLVVPSRSNDTFGNGRELEPNTFVGGEPWEEDVPHHYFSDEELNSLLIEFSILHLEEKEVMSHRINMMRHSFELIAKKKG